MESLSAYEEASDQPAKEVDEKEMAEILLVISKIHETQEREKHRIGWVSNYLSNVFDNSYQMSGLEAGPAPAGTAWRRREILLYLW